MAIVCEDLDQRNSLGDITLSSRDAIHLHGTWIIEEHPPIVDFLGGNLVLAIQ
jgi:hypothetical protein